MSQAMDLLVGKVLGNRFEILQKLGEGGMGVVYKARQTFQDKIIALKIIKPEYMREIDFMNRFIREVKNASKVTHPNAAAIFDSGLIENDMLYMAMEYVAGERLSELINFKTIRC